MDRLLGVRAKIERANKHISEFDALFKSLRDSNTHTIGAYRDPETSRLVYYLASAPSPEQHAEMAVLVGDILQNIRSALDHLVHQLIAVEQRHEGPFAHSEFPISDSAEEHEARKGGKIKGMGKEAIDAIDATHPYKGGTDALWQIHQLNRIDKHRLLITVSANLTKVDIGSMLLQAMAQHVPESFGIDLPDQMSLEVIPADLRCRPLKQGDELFQSLPGAEPDENLKFMVQIALHEPGVIECEPVLPTLKNFADLVDDIAHSFAPLLG